MSDTPGTKPITVEQAADLLGHTAKRRKISPEVLREAIEAGELAGRKISGQYWTTAAALTRWVESGGKSG